MLQKRAFQRDHLAQGAGRRSHATDGDGDATSRQWVTAAGKSAIIIANLQSAIE
jgi:hypothetical protein